jgi:(2Fe-2S) ferredoxin
MTDSYFKYHVFFCCNQRDNNENCCANYQSNEVRMYAKERIKQLNLNSKGNVRINQAGCLDRCEQGPVLVIYPEGTWYTYVDQNDIDEIIDSHLIQNKMVTRLKIT